ncbi:chemotaxis protein CheY [Roseivivax isoporae LMG 25204]|uniref:Chemotaxis protein CheY n=1 Tax=Roseivivax isoporae LMG 25204 TaxID=1449351 RepID=X7FB19_9RHOB|nr:chemotaxis protein CheY [Roseivivax isoporae LMG 25204]
MIALDIQLELEAAGWTVVGPALTLRRARELLSTGTFRLALLDINVGRDTSFDFAQACIDADIRVVFMTGHSNQRLPEALRCCDLIRKPVQMRELTAMLG